MTLADLRSRAAVLKRQTHTLTLALADPRVPLAPKVIVALTLAYALSPIDLIPDFIPVIGLLDDLILVPLGLALAVRLIPTALWSDLQQKAAASTSTPSRTLRLLGLGIVLAIWAGVVAIGWHFWAR